MTPPKESGGDEDHLAAMRAANGHDFGLRRGRKEFTNWIDEQLSWKETCYIGDWSFLANLKLRGTDAVDLLSTLSVNTFESFSVGQAKHLIQCSAGGDVIAEGVLSRTAEDEFVVHGLPCYWTAYNLETGERGRFEVETEWRDTFNFQVQGPRSIELLEELTDAALSDIEFIHFDTVDIAGVDVTAIRMGMAGELGFELQGPAGEADAVWDAIVDAGSEYGLRRLSERTSSINHLEACFPTRGRDYVPAIFSTELAPFRSWVDAHASRDVLTYPIEGSFSAEDISAWYRTPVELGWERNVALDHEFLGREALESELADPERTIVTLVWNDEDVVDVYASLFEDGPHNKYMEMPHQQKRAMIADEVRRDGDPVGVSTCRGYSYYFREMLSLCTIDVASSEPGTEVTVVWGEGANPKSPTVESHEQTTVRATVAPAPYKDDNRRVDPRSR
ncbi:aminomethyl transferase family protein [Halobellus sp. GM3]|uniref:aminomethyl transferase family protein n=1 Tax=Halobellus sp. GM3 TaxID=3458410 RepID=UPI00403D6D2C